MSLELCVLASGSSGNCSVVRTPTGVMLLDAGIGPRLVSRRLTGTGVQVSDVSAICLTHLDSDHFAPVWVNHIIRLGIAVHCHVRCVDTLMEIAENRLLASFIRPFDNSRFTPLPEITATPIALAHDEEGCHAFVLEGFGQRLGYATDLGHVPDPLVEHFIDLDVLALESNYDPLMQERSPRPIFLKRRITGGRGHLSNQQALDAIRRMLDRAERRAMPLPAHIVLLHRSRQCNCPKLVRELFSKDHRIAPRLVLAEAFSRSEWLSAANRPIAAGEQLALSWG
ncbi:MAG TPA: MBL fold metallo-hydrolase [Humisphaera sp.]|nr:MBL fold metallo-hydrolase [Humisphaera sp.]